MIIFESTFPNDYRSAEIKKILSSVLAGKFCQVVCIPGAGKATVLRLLAHNRSVLKFHLAQKEKLLRVVYVNFFELTSYGEAEIAKFLLLALDEKIQKNADSLVFIKQLSEAVNKLADQGHTLVFLFDHFDEHQNQLPRSFFQLLKTLTAVAKYKFSVVFATRRDLVDLVDEEITRDYWDFFVGNTIYLSVYGQKAVDVLFAQIEKVFSKKLTGAQKKLIIDLTGGHAKLTKIITELLLQENVVLEKDKLIQNHQVRAALGELWLFLTSEEQHELYLLTQNKEIAQSNVLDTLIKFDLVTIPYRSLDDPGSIRDRAKQSNNKAIQQYNNFVFTIPLFAEFIKTLPDDTIHQKIVFDPTTKQVLRGKDDISELLSPQEYRLMKFLIENQGRIVERDELIAAVWPDTQVTEAVSDEAIDQMVFRLRKKIEDEPAKPKHLLTVKGRGIRFEA